MRASRHAVVLALCAAGVLTGCAGKKPAASEGRTPPAAAQGAEATGCAGAAGADAPKPRKPFGLMVAEVLSAPAKLFPKKKKPPQAVPALQVGEVKQVNMENKFVLIDITGGRAIEPGASLVCLSEKKQTAELRLTSLRGSSFFIADIVSGKPSAKDGVYLK